MSGRITRLILLVRFNLRRLGSDGAAPWVIGGVVLVAAFAAVAVPRYLNRVSDEAVAAVLEDANPRSRNVMIEQGLRIQPDTDAAPLSHIVDQGDDFASEFPPELTDVISGRTFFMDSQTFLVSQYPGDVGDPPQRTLRFRYQSEISDWIEIVDGRLPAPAEPIQVSFDDGESFVELAVHEMAVTAQTAGLMQLGVGDRAVIAPQVPDPLAIGVPSSRLQYMLVVEVAGIIELREPSNDYWFGDERLHRASLSADPGNPDATIVAATALVAPEDYRQLLRETRPVLWNYGWRFFVDPSRFDAGDTAAIAGGLQELQLNLGAGSRGAIDEPRLTTSLDALFNRFEGQRAVTVASLSLVGAGLAVLALSLVAMLGVLTGQRRRPATVLQRGRGGTVGQLWRAQFVEGLVIYLPVAFAGFWTARLLIDAREPAAVAALLLVGVAIVAALWAAMAVSGRNLTGDDTPTGESTKRRIVVEILVGVAGIGGLLLFRRRGLTATTLGGSTDFDPLLAAVPVLLGLTIGLAALRAYPLIVRTAGWVGARWGDVVAFVALRRLRAQSLPTQLPLVVTIVAVGMAVFGVLVSASVSQARSNGAWQEVGADFRLESFGTDDVLSPLLDISGVGGIEATADAALFEGRLALDRSVAGVPTSVLALDLIDYIAVTTGTPVDARFPDSVIAPLMVTISDPIPSILSEMVLNDRAVNPGDVLELRLTSLIRVPLFVEQTRTHFPGLSAGESFVVLDRSALAAAAPGLDLQTTDRYLRAPAELVDPLRAAVGEGFATRLSSRAEIDAQLSAEPLIAAVDAGYRISVVLASLFAVLAALAAIALSSNERARDVAMLRTLGLSVREGGLMTLVEQVPWVVFAVLSGVGFGAALSWLIAPAVELSSFTGVETPVDITFTWAPILAVAVAVVAALVLAVGAYSYRFRRTSLGDVLRVGDQ